MDDRDFQRLYHDYHTTDRAEAQRLADRIALSDGRHPIVVGLPFGATRRYCLLLPSAAELVHRLHPEIEGADDGDPTA